MKKILKLLIAPIALLPIFSCNRGVTHVHSTYAGYCEECNKLINGLEFKKSTITTMPRGGYPRIIRLKNGNLLYGVDGPEMKSYISEDNGKSWIGPSVFSFRPNHDVANSDFFEMDNGDIIACYRAVNPHDSYEDIKYNWGIQSSISKDGGYTWSELGQVAATDDTDDYPDLDKVKYIINNKKDHGGLWEPFVCQCNGKILCFYSDDFGGWYDDNPTDHEFQYLCSKELNLNGDRKWINRNIAVNGLKIKTGSKLPQVTSRDGMPTIAQMSDGTYIMTYEGTYRRNDEVKHPFVILLTTSKDGINWTDPVEIYTPYGRGTKAGAPYVSVTNDDCIVVCFQTEEDYQEHGGTDMGEHHCICKVIISDGTPVDKIDKTCFYGAYNVFHEDYWSTNSLWNMVEVEDDTIYAFTDGKMNYSKIGEFDEINRYSLEDSMSGYTVKRGDFVKLKNGTYSPRGENNYLIKNIDYVTEGVISTYVTPRYRNSVGLEVMSTYGDSYRFVMSEDRGDLLLITGDSILARNSALKDTFTYDPNRNYKLTMEFSGRKMKCYVDDRLYIDHKQFDLPSYFNVGLYAAKPGSIFFDLTVN